MQYGYSQNTGHLFGIELGASKTKLSNKIKISLLYLSLENNHGTKWLGFVYDTRAVMNFPSNFTFSSSSSKGFFMDACGAKEMGRDTEIA